MSKTTIINDILTVEDYNIQYKRHYKNKGVQSCQITIFQKYIH